CSNVIHSKGYCNKHYLQLWKHKKLTPELERIQVDHCVMPNCKGKIRAKGYCSKHYYQFVTKEKNIKKLQDETTKELVTN
ncbi:hypothetical protein ACQUY5_32330, partial [Bacillus cereus]